MTGLKIQVNGRGMIPRGYGLAPRKEPFLATDIHLIYLILNTAGLSIKFVNPKTNNLEDLTKKNMKAMWDKYANYTAQKEPAAAKPAEAEPVKEETKVEETSASPASVNGSNVPVAEVPPVSEEPQADVPAEAEPVKEETKVEDQQPKQDNNSQNNKINYSNKNKQNNKH